MHILKTSHIVLSVLVLGTLIATCYRVLSLQRSFSSSNHDIIVSTNDAVVTISTTSPTDAKTDTRNLSTTVAPLHNTPNSSVIHQQPIFTASNGSTPHNATIPRCIPPFSTSSTINRIPKRQIFVDFGANDAHSVELFLNSSTIYWNEIESYSKRVANLRRSNNTGAMLGWEVHVFEANPNPVLLQKQEEQRLYMVTNNLTQSYHLYNSTAITTHDGFIEVFSFLYSHILSFL